MFIHMISSQRNSPVRYFAVEFYEMMQSKVAAGVIVVLSHARLRRSSDPLDLGEPVGHKLDVMRRLQLEQESCEHVVGASDGRLLQAATIPHGYTFNARYRSNVHCIRAIGGTAHRLPD